MLLSLLLLSLSVAAAVTRSLTGAGGSETFFGSCGSRAVLLQEEGRMGWLVEGGREGDERQKNT